MRVEVGEYYRVDQAPFLSDCIISKIYSNEEERENMILHSFEFLVIYLILHQALQGSIPYV